MKRGMLALLLSFACAGVFLAQEPNQDSGSLLKPARIRTGVDLVVADAVVTRQKTGEVIQNLQKDDFVLLEDGVLQRITHFSQDTLPLSVILLVDRGACLDPFSSKVRAATREALARLKPEDEVALMTFSETTQLVRGFGEDRRRIADALELLPDHESEGNHCFNRAFYEAASYIRQAGNPDGRRVIIMITGWTTSFDCGGPSAQETRQAVFESGSVICGLVPRTAAQQFESGMVGMATGVARMFKFSTSSLKQLADETGGEVFNDTPANLDRSFNDLIDHLRTRYTLGFVSSNLRRDGAFRKLKLQISPEVYKREGKLAVKTRRGYVAPLAPPLQTVNDRVP